MLDIEGKHCVGIVDKMSLATILIENITYMAGKFSIFLLIHHVHFHVESDGQFS